MTSAVLEKSKYTIDDNINDINDIDDVYDEYYEEDYELYHNPKLIAALDEAMAEAEDIMAHPENYKFYDSVKEMLCDMGFDVSNLPDD